jgi:Flp pilus assembly protein CpaB
MKFNKKILIVALFMAIITTYGAYRYISSFKNSIKYKYVLMAKTDIPARTKIEESMVALKKTAEEYVLKNAMTDMNAVVGKYSSDKIMAGEQLLPERIIEEQKSGFSYQIPNDKRAVTIAVDGETGVAGLIKTGDTVDVIVYLTKQEVQDKASKSVYPDVAKIALQNIPVLAVNDKDSSGSTDGIKLNSTSQDKVKYITLLVNPQEAEQLVLMRETGKIYLALRSPADDGSYNSQGAIRGDIVTDKGKIIIGK